MAHKPRVVANAILRKAREEGQIASMSHLKLQKMIFFLHAWGLALDGTRVVEEGPEAWPYGPVFASLYHELKTNGSRPITEYLLEPQQESGKKVALVPNPGDKAFWGLLDKVWARYGHLTASQLSKLSHEAGGPWEQARQQKLTNMPDPATAEFYRAKLQAHDGAARG